VSTESYVLIDRLPAAIEPFIAFRDRLAVTPEGGAAVLIAALLLCAKDAELGQAALAVAVDRDSLQSGDGGFQGWELRPREMQRVRLQLAEQPYLPQSYIKGTTPLDGYDLPEPPYAIIFASNPYGGDIESGEYKVFVACSGASRPRPVSLRKDRRDIWKAREWSSLIMGIVPAPEEGAPDL